MNRLSVQWLLIAAFVFAPPASAATFSVSYNDDPNEGFNDPGPPDPQSATDGNPGTTLGEQRQWAFEQGLDHWGQRLQSDVTIKVDAEMNDLTCDSNSAILGSAGATTVHRDWSPNPPQFAETWYGQALANRISQTDLCDATCESNQGLEDSDIGATFNKMIDESTNCLGSNTWYYALGDAPSGTVSFFKTVLHEIGHGVNVFTLVDLTNGEKAVCSASSSTCDDVYMKFLEAHGLGDWPNLTNQQREDSAIDTNNLHWTGANVLAAIGSLSDGTSGGHVEMYAPSPLESGSSVSHWDVDVDDAHGSSELMEPSATGVEKIYMTDEMLEDMGWNEFSACGPSLADEVTISSQVATSDTTYQACRTLTMGSDFAVQTNVDVIAEAPYGVAINGEFAVDAGATFKIRLSPTIGTL